MAYSPNIPQPTDIPANSQPQLLANFQGINTLINVNHIGFDVTDQGKHKWVTCPDQVLAVPTTLNTEVALFSATNADTGKIELNFVRQNNGSVIPFTATVNGPDGGLNVGSGWTLLPSGILLKWATGTINSSGTFTFSANSFGKAFTKLFNVQVTSPLTSFNNVYVCGGVVPSTTNITVLSMVRNSSGTPISSQFAWLAIGV